MAITPLELLPDDTSSVNTFALNQAGLTISKLPSSGFGALVNVVDGTEAGTGLYAPSYSYAGNVNSGSHLDVLQAYVQYATGKWTVLAGKFGTLAGSEVAAPTGDVNVTRSLLFWYNEPINHTGVRAIYAASATASFTIGVNNGWNTETSTGSGKTLELGFMPDAIEGVHAEWRRLLWRCRCRRGARQENAGRPGGHVDGQPVVHDRGQRRLGQAGNHQRPAVR
jgi:hypothetical protein